MITKQDIAKLTKIFPTRTEMDARFDQMENRLDEKFDDKFNSFRTEIKDLVLTSHDEIMGELKAMREELAGYAFRQREHSDQLENHDGRITVLEKNFH